MNINLTPIIQAIITLLAALITYRLVPWLKSRVDEDRQAKFNALIKSLVFAAEQIYGAGNGEGKLDYVCGQLRERGYEVDLAMIEATVYEQFNQFLSPRVAVTGCVSEAGESEAVGQDAVEAASAAEPEPEETGPEANVAEEPGETEPAEHPPDEA